MSAPAPPRPAYCECCGHSNRSHNELRYCQIGGNYGCPCDGTSVIPDEQLSPAARKRRAEAEEQSRAWFAWRDSVEAVR